MNHDRRRTPVLGQQTVRAYCPMQTVVSRERSVNRILRSRYPDCRPSHGLREFGGVRVHARFDLDLDVRSARRM